MYNDNSRKVGSKMELHPDAVQDPELLAKMIYNMIKAIDNLVQASNKSYTQNLKLIIEVSGRAAPID